MKATARAAALKFAHPVVVVRRPNRIAAARVGRDDSSDVFAAPAGILFGVASGSLIWVALAWLVLRIV